MQMNLGLTWRLDYCLQSIEALWCCQAIVAIKASGADCVFQKCFEIALSDVRNAYLIAYYEMYYSLSNSALSHAYIYNIALNYSINYFRCESIWNN